MHAVCLYNQASWQEVHWEGSTDADWQAVAQRRLATGDSLALKGQHTLKIKHKCLHSVKRLSCLVFQKHCFSALSPTQRVPSIWRRYYSRHLQNWTRVPLIPALMTMWNTTGLLKVLCFFFLFRRILQVCSIKAVPSATPHTETSSRSGPLVASHDIIPPVGWPGRSSSEQTACQKTSMSPTKNRKTTFTRTHNLCF